MLKKLLATASILSLLFMASCKVTMSGEASVPGASGRFDLDIESGTSDPCEDAKSLGSATVTMEDGTVLKGEVFDCDGDGVPDQFKPAKGQGGDTSYGETDGETYYPVTPI